MNSINITYGSTTYATRPLAGLLGDWHWRRMDGLHRLALQAAFVAILLAASVMIGETGKEKVPGPTQTVSLTATSASV